MITYKKTNSNVGLSGVNSFQQQANSDSKVNESKPEQTKAQVDRDDFESIVLALMSSLQGEAETSRSGARNHFLKLLKNQLAVKKPILDDILNLIHNTKF
jgi:hypothetical protein